LEQIIISILAVFSPAIAVKILKIPLIETSKFLILPLGLGAIFGAGIVVKFGHILRKKYFVGFGLFLIGTVFAFISLIIPHIVKGKVFWGSISAFWIGIGFVVSLVPLQTLLQERIPEKLRGRVYGLLTSLITLSALVPVLFSATVGDILGELALFGILSVILFILGFFVLKFEDSPLFLLFIKLDNSFADKKIRDE